MAASGSCRYIACGDGRRVLGNYFHVFLWRILSLTMYREIM